MKKPLAPQGAARSWAETRELYHQLLRVLYKKNDPRRARQLADQLEPVLCAADPNEETVFGEECRSLIHEARGDLRKAIEHRQNEICLIRRLQALSRDKPYEQGALRGYTRDDLADRLNLLAMLYHANANLGQAIKTLREAEQFCAEEGIEFDAADLLQEYLAERRNRQRQLK